MAEVLWRANRLNEAREVLHKVLPLVNRRDSLRVARLQTRLGRVEVDDSILNFSAPAWATQCYEAAIAAFDAAEQLLGGSLAEINQQRSDVWLEIQVDGRANLYNWWNEPGKGAEVLSRARPVVERRGSLARKAGFYAQFANQRARETGFRIDEEMLASLRACLAMARQAADEFDIVSALFCLGVHLLFHDDLIEARSTLEKAITISERIGGRRDAISCLSYLCMAALRQHDVEAVRSLAPRVLAESEAAGYPTQVGEAKATMAWVAWQDGRNDDAAAKAGEALKLWKVSLCLIGSSGFASGRS